MIPVKSPAYFGFDEPNVSENYGFAFAYKTTETYELLAIDTTQFTKNLDEYHRDLMQAYSSNWLYSKEYTRRSMEQ